MRKSKSASISPLPEGGSKQIPGSDKWKFWQLFSLLRKGQGFFHKRIEKHKSTVFRMNIGVKAIAVCDRKGAEVLFDLEKIYKEPKFGRLNYNLSLLPGDNIPSIFINGKQHELQKAFVMKVCEIAQKADVLNTANAIVPEYLDKWHRADNQLKNDWEDDVMSLVSDIFSQAFLGIRLDSACMHDMVYASWTKKKSELARGQIASQRLIESLKLCPKLTGILEIAKEMELTEEQAIADVLFMLNFNGYGAISGSLRSALAKLHNADQEMKQNLQRDIVNNLGEEGVTHESLKKMKLLDRFILEVFRMEPPVPLLFGKAINDFILQSSTGSFEVKRDELLIANVYMIQRDPAVFTNPDTFLPSRFEDERLLDHMLFTNGPFTQEASTQNHHCAGKEIIFTVMKAILIPVIQDCDFTFTEIPYWTGKKLRRIGCPDNTLELKDFIYTPNGDLQQRSDLEIEDVN